MTLRRLLVVLVGALVAAPLFAVTADARPGRRLAGEGARILQPERAPASAEAPSSAPDGGVEPANHWTCGPDDDLPEPALGMLIHELDNAQGALESASGETAPGNLAQELAGVIGCSRTPTGQPPSFDPPSTDPGDDETDAEVAAEAAADDTPALPLTGASAAGTTLAGGLLASAALVVRRRWLA